MLESLEGISRPRETKPDEVPEWLRLVTYISQHIAESNHSCYSDDGNIISIRHAIHGIERFTVDDLKCYVDMQQNHCDDQSPDMMGYTDRIGFMMSCMLERVCKNADVEAIYVDGLGTKVPFPFCDIHTVDKPIIIDNFRGRNLLKGQYNDLPFVAVTNCTSNSILDNYRCNHHHKVILANCTSQTIFPHSNRLGTDYTILANCDFDTLHGSIDLYSDHLIAVNCKREGQIYERFIGPNHVPYSGLVVEQLTDLSLQMQGKNGLEVYKLGKQMISLLEGEKHA